MIRQLAVVRLGTARIPRALRDLPVLDAIGEDLMSFQRLVVLGPARDLSAVLSALLRADRLDIEVAPVRRSWRARRARTAGATRVPLIRDETGSVITGSAYWRGPDGQPRLRGEAVVDDAQLFDGEVPAVRVEPTATLPGLRAAVCTDGWAGRWRPKRWLSGRAAQLGTTGAAVIRDGDRAPRVVRRSTFYRHTEGWLRV